MRKTWLIACREYLAFVRTVGFWLSLLTVPLIFGSSLFLPLFLRLS
jgi:ABC-2 type transport system permease protein